ncbi:hypothetical protein [Thaumasiovibrio subtropicus]|uniref:hypothetical protein n=1 Tax=Thaumasiovibrio subtropicus TaxID=1891207 RepID=UPI000B34E22C|nr:hypothetical protein [Thaumasiovibrio subtropicus]
MGFFDSVKSLTNAITGGAATVTLQCDRISFNEPFKVVVTAVTESTSVKLDRVYLYLQGYEEVEVPDVDIEYEDDGDVRRRTETVRASNETVDLDITVAEAQELEPHQTYEWEVEIELPSDAPKIYRGHYCQHTYRVLAGLDCFGNDPDSGWVELYD